MAVVRIQRNICMGAEGVGILQHDLALDVVDLFYEHFDGRTPCMEIPQSLRLQIGFDDLDDAEKEVFCSALIECLWQVGAETSQYEQLVSTLDNCEGVLQYWGSSYSRRRAAVQKLLRKVQVPKAKPRKPKAPRKPREPLFSPGDYIAYKRSNGRYVAMILWAMENCFGMEYYFALPNLSRVSDHSAVDRFLSLDSSLTESELAGFFTQKRRFRFVAIKEKVLKANSTRFHCFGNKPFPPSGWLGTGGGNSALDMDMFECLVNGNGSRSLSDAELSIIKCEQSVEPECG
jgi:hypothetical protein